MKIMTKREMKYSTNTHTVVLYMSNIEDYNYYIISYGTHPCCYVELPKEHKLYGMTYNEIEEKYDINVHGGFTYSRPDLLIKDDSWFLGWDYAHCWDYSPYLEDLDLKKWTTDELIGECCDVIAQLVKINQKED